MYGRVGRRLAPQIDVMEQDSANCCLHSLENKPLDNGIFVLAFQPCKSSDSLNWHHTYGP